MITQTDACPSLTSPKTIEGTADFISTHHKIWFCKKAGHTPFIYLLSFMAHWLQTNSLHPLAQIQAHLACWTSRRLFTATILIAGGSFTTTWKLLRIALSLLLRLPFQTFTRYVAFFPTSTSCCTWTDKLPFKNSFHLLLCFLGKIIWLRCHLRWKWRARSVFGIVSGSMKSKTAYSVMTWIPFEIRPQQRLFELHVCFFCIFLRYSGKHVWDSPGYKRSSGRDVLIVFHSDASLSGGHGYEGFNLRYSFVCASDPVPEYQPGNYQRRTCCCCFLFLNFLSKANASVAHSFPYSVPFCGRLHCGWWQPFHDYLCRWYSNGAWSLASAPHVLWLASIYTLLWFCAIRSKSDTYSFHLSGLCFCIF